VSFEDIDPQIQNDIAVLERFGILSDEFPVWGTKYTIRTLKGDEELAAGVVTKEYVETLAQSKSWAWANISMAVDAVNGNYDYCPRVQVDPIEFARSRFRYWTGNYTWALGERLFEYFVELQRRELTARQAMQDFRETSPTPSSHGLDLLSDLGISTDDLATEG